MAVDWGALLNPNYRRQEINIVSGYVSPNRTPPASFDDPIWVILPVHGTDNPYGPLAWPAIHGATKPTQGTPVVLAFDEGGTPLVLTWSGTHT